MAPRRKSPTDIAGQSDFRLRQHIINKFKIQRERSKKIGKLSISTVRSVIPYIGPEWRCGQRKSLEKLRKRRVKTRYLSNVSTHSANMSDVSDSSAFNVFSDLIPRDSLHETVVLDDTTFCGTNAEADITITKRVNIEDVSQTPRSLRAPTGRTILQDGDKEVDEAGTSKDIFGDNASGGVTTVTTIDDSSSDSDASVVTLADSISESSQRETSTIAETKEVEVIAFEEEKLDGSAVSWSIPDEEDLTLVDESRSTDISGAGVEQSRSIIGAPIASTSNSLQEVLTPSYCIPRVENGPILKKGFRENFSSYRFSAPTPYQPTFPAAILASRTFHAIDSPMGFVDLLTEGTANLCRTVLRRWVFAQTSAMEGAPIRICSYNVLCQNTISKTPYLYKHLTGIKRSYQLEWEYRSSLLARELLMISADVLCLQEVQEDHFHSFYLPVLARAGYRGEFKKRTREMFDGCAIFYRFPLQLLSYQPIEYFVGVNTVLDRDNIGQLVRFKEALSGKEICIANTHLLFNKQRGDVKLAQLAVLLANLDKECGPESARKCPYVICGDFNMQPYCHIYDFLIEGHLSFNNLRRADLSGQGSQGGPLLQANFMPPQTNIDMNCRFGVKRNGAVESSEVNRWTHSLKFASAYTHMSHDRWPEVSTFHCNGAANPDFLFYSINSRITEVSKGGTGEVAKIDDSPLHLVRHLSLPSELALRTTLGPWPNAVTPSDHIPLIADFILH
uniref:Endonuclease/exonuclease/phosphatase domain-containing protein n=1 Tax=Parascaris univalens TaxID=6257 RepID=A0A915AED2_PARUN